MDKQKKKSYNDNKFNLIKLMINLNYQNYLKKHKENIDNP